MYPRVTRNKADSAAERTDDEPREDKAVIASAAEEITRLTPVASLGLSPGPTRMVLHRPDGILYETDMLDEDQANRVAVVQWLQATGRECTAPQENRILSIRFPPRRNPRASSILM